MTVYHVYTKTVHIPTFVVYECQKCKAVVSTVGYYDLSASYSDRGASRKRFAQREAEAVGGLLSNASSKEKLLQKLAVEVEDDFRSLQCKCPTCGHLSVSKIGNPKKLAFGAALAVAAAFWIYLIIGFIGKPDKSGIGSTILGGIFFSVCGVGILSMIFEAIIEAIAKAQMRSLRKKTPPIVSASRDLLIERAKRTPAYQNADFSGIMKYPAVLQAKGSNAPAEQ